MPRKINYKKLLEEWEREKETKPIGKRSISGIVSRSMADPSGYQPTGDAELDAMNMEYFERKQNIDLQNEHLRKDINAIDNGDLLESRTVFDPNTGRIAGTMNKYKGVPGEFYNTAGKQAPARVEKYQIDGKWRISGSESPNPEWKSSSGSNPNDTSKINIPNDIHSLIGVDPELKYVDKYNTPLSKDEFNDFYNWAIEKYGDVKNLLYEMGTYDIQGAWKSGDVYKTDSRGHGTDKWKKPNHRTFSEESKYSTIDNKGGVWKETENGSMFYPSKSTIELYGKDQIIDYFNKHEQGVDVIFD